MTNEELAQEIKATWARLDELRSEQQARTKILADSRLITLQEKVHQHYGPAYEVRVQTSHHDYDVYFEMDVPSGVSVVELSDIEKSFFNDPEVFEKLLTGSLFVSPRFLK